MERGCSYGLQLKSTDTERAIGYYYNYRKKQMRRMGNDKIMKKAGRNSNIEVLRIISMFFIVLSHYAFHSPFGFTGTKISINQIYTQITALGNVGVNVFVLISATFLYRKGFQQYSIKRLFPIWRSMFFYSVFFYIVFVSTKTISFGTKGFIKSLFPVIFETWWFGTTYILLCLFYPFLNMLIERLDNRSYFRLLAVIFVTWCLVPTFSGQYLKSNDITWFLCLYLFAGFIEKNISRNRKKASYYFLRALMFYFFYIVWIVASDALRLAFPSFGDRALYFTDKQRLLILPLSIYLFLGFKNINEFYSSAVNIISKSMFGVYLISEYPEMRQLIWSEWNPGLKHTESGLFILFSIGYCMVVFIVCSIIEIIRLHTFEAIACKAFNRFEDIVTVKIRKIIQKDETLMIK